MKNRLTFIYLILPLVTLFFASCQEDIVTYNDGYDDGLTPAGAPVIERIILATDTASQPVELNGATLATMIAIQGRNLSQVESIRFNDVEADLRTAYAVNSKIVVPVPRRFPDAVDNKLTVTTSMGSTSVDFVVGIPDLIVTGLANEFAAPGDTVSIVGDNFDLYNVNEETGVIELNGNSLELIAASATELSFVIPDGTADNSTIRISSPDVDVPVEVGFREQGFLVQNFDGLWGDVEQTRTDGSNPGDPRPLFGVDEFCRLSGEFGAWSWNTPYGGGFTVPDEDFVRNPGNYYLKFEMCTNRPLAVGNIVLGEGYQWNPATGGISFNTNRQWRTIRLELVDIVNAGWIMEVGSWRGFALVFQPTADANVDFSFANIRIVRK